MRNEQGFTLIEVVVALVVASLLVLIVMRAAQDDAYRQHAALQRDAAVLLARAVLDRQGAGFYRAGEQRGDAGTLRWVSREKAVLQDPRGLLVLAEMAIEVHGSENQLLVRTTLRKLKRMPPQ